MARRSIAVRDATLREGMDVPGVHFDLEQRIVIAAALAESGVDEAEVVAPARVGEDAAAARTIRERGIGLRCSGLVYANRPEWRGDAEISSDALDRFDLLMPLSPEREPRDAADKARVIEQTVGACRAMPVEVGAGFPHATQVELTAVVDVARRSADAGAERITIYDTNGSADPYAVGELIGAVVSAVDVPVFFHAHNDLGMATANSWAAVRAGAAGLDLTVNGLGDRAGNGSLEQVVVLLARMGIETGVDLGSLLDLSRLVAELSGEPVGNLAPVVGRYAFDHRSPAHLDVPGEFEAIDPERLGTRRTT
jgi:homocitrate synthase NifV